MRPPVVDLHEDLLFDALRRRIKGERQTLRQYHLPQLRQAGVKIQVLPIYFDGDTLPESGLRQTVLTANTFLQEMDESGDHFAVIKTKGDLEAAKQGDKIGVILAMEGAEGLGRDVALVRFFFEVGLRMLGLTWNRANALAEGCGEDTGAGLSCLGRELVRGLADYPVILDVSHLSETSFWSALDHCRGPVLASHSNSAAVCPHRRNLTDQQIKALAARGGLVGLNFYPEFVGDGPNLLEELLRHADHIIKLVGIEHLALGPDFVDYMPELASPALPTVAILPDFYEALLGHGFSEEEAAAIMGGNACRFLAETLPA